MLVDRREIRTGGWGNSLPEKELAQKKVDKKLLVRHKSGLSGPKKGKNCLFAPKTGLRVQLEPDRSE